MHRTVAPVLALLLAIGVLPGRVAAAGAESDIPGIPLPDTIVTGVLGGSIYDVVYSVQIPPGYVLVSALTGSGGTDFDLYLFPPAATTVVDSAQAIAKSTMPSSSEYISHASRLGGTYYLDLNGASDVQGTYRLEVRIVPDPTPATVSMRFAGGITITNTPNVTIELTAADDLSGVAEMSFSADGTTWTEWVPFQANAPYQLTGGDGRKRIYGRVRNGSGQVSATVASITLDTTPPTVTASSPAPDGTIGATKPSFTVTFSEPILVRTWFDNGLVVREPGGQVVPGAYAYDAATMTGRFTPSADLVLGYDYSVTIGAISDIAGNLYPPSSPWTVGARQASRVTLTPVPATTYGRAVTLSGSSSAPAGSELRLEARRLDETAYTSVATLVAQTGGVTWRVSPEATTVYRLSFAGTATLASAVSATTVVVRRAVTIAGPGPSVTRSARARRNVTVSAVVRPAVAGTRVTFTLYRRVGTAWRRSTVRAATTRTDGTAAIAWRPTAGRWYWKASVPATGTLAAGTSPNYRWTVR